MLSEYIILCSRDGPWLLLGSVVWACVNNVVDLYCLLNMPIPCLRHDVYTQSAASSFSTRKREIRRL